MSWNWFLESLSCRNLTAAPRSSTSLHTRSPPSFSRKLSERFKERSVSEWLNLQSDDINLLQFDPVADLVGAFRSQVVVRQVQRQLPQGAQALVIHEARNRLRRVGSAPVLLEVQVQLLQGALVQLLQSLDDLAHSHIPQLDRGQVDVQDLQLEPQLRQRKEKCLQVHAVADDALP